MKNNRQKTRPPQVKIPGVIGGMGPEATVDFLAKIVASADATCDQDHIRMLLDHNPTLPSRQAALASDPAPVGEAIAAMAKGLEKSGADFIVIPSNTAHAFLPFIKAAITIPIVDIIEETVSQIQKASIGTDTNQQVGIMATPACRAANLYQAVLVAEALHPVVWPEQEEADFMALVYEVKAGTAHSKIKPAMKKLALSLVDKGATALIAGCTEIPLILEPSDLPVPFFSSTDILVERTLCYALGKEPLPSMGQR